MPINPAVSSTVGSFVLSVCNIYSKFSLMELSEAVKRGLQFLNKSDDYVDIIDKAFNTVEHPIQVNFRILAEPISNDGHYALTTILIMASKQKYSEQQIYQLLESYLSNAEIIQRIASKYETQRDRFIHLNASYGITLPHVTDANWTLRSDLSSSSYSITAGNLSFLIELESFNRKNSEKTSIVRFTCTPEELQLFINKLKDIELNCDKLTK
ncbi:COMM domain-containing protein 3 isoform X1 [Uranotaenia lowii]|uniref:COMM domain-containing protein 3 isoform X1 n=1 Tax=Uranotaenia lowii TaxID=190385 RepID=UPI002478A151|nr:COMM domain-containing protein 3 isoform X1 [Uranotaenia lowii]